jgi:hypothetical protein
MGAKVFISGAEARCTTVHRRWAAECQSHNIDANKLRGLLSPRLPLGSCPLFIIGSSRASRRFSKDVAELQPSGLGSGVSPAPKGMLSEESLPVRGSSPVSLSFHGSDYGSGRLASLFPRAPVWLERPEERDQVRISCDGSWASSTRLKIPPCPLASGVRGGNHAVYHVGLIEAFGLQVVHEVVHVIRRRMTAGASAFPQENHLARSSLGVGFLGSSLPCTFSFAAGENPTTPQNSTVVWTWLFRSRSLRRTSSR